MKWNEVPDHMHVESGFAADEPEEEEILEPVYRTPVPKDHSLYGSWKEDRELEAIFNRTFGSKGERQIPSYHKVSYGRLGGVSEANREATAAYKEAHSRPQDMQKDYLLVDGYNIIFAWEELKALAADNLDAARLKLMDMLCNYQGYTHCELICVFDAYKVKGGQGEVVCIIISMWFIRKKPRQPMPILKKRPKNWPGNTESAWLRQMAWSR